MKPKQIHIIETAITLFGQQGIRAVTMADITAECGISKKTLYQYFTNKSTLIEYVVKHFVGSIEQHIRIWPNISPNAISEIRYYFQYTEAHLSLITPRFMSDIQQYYNTAYRILLQYTNEKLLPFLARNIARGQHENLYRMDIDAHFIAKLYGWFIQKISSDISLQIAKEHHKFITCVNELFLCSILNGNGRKMALNKESSSPIIK